MIYIDRIGCTNIKDKGKRTSVESLGDLTRAACRIAKANRLGLLRNSRGHFRIIRECGLGAYEELFTDLADVDDFLKHLDEHDETRYY